MAELDVQTPEIKKPVIGTVPQPKKVDPKLAEPIMFVPGPQGTNGFSGFILRGDKWVLRNVRLPYTVTTESELKMVEDVIATTDREDGTNGLYSDGHILRIEGAGQIGEWKGENKKLNQVLIRSLMGSVKKQNITDVGSVAVV